MLLGQQIKDRWCRDINHMVVQDAAACLHPQPFVFQPQLLLSVSVNPLSSFLLCLLSHLISLSLF